MFAAIDAHDRTPLATGQLTLLHSGIVYPDERDPTALMAALGMLRAASSAGRGAAAHPLSRAVHEAMLHALATAHGVDAMIDVAPALSYREALAEMMRADGLLILQAANCNEQIPAKLYEYLRARRPIVALTDPAGDTAATLRRTGGAHVAPLDDATAIADLLRRFVTEPGLREDLPDAAAVAQCSRRARTAALASLLDASASAGAGAVADAKFARHVARDDDAPGLRR